MAFLTYITTFVLIILAELGDKTQVATLIFASNNPKRKWQVLLAAALALSLCVTVEVTIGLTLAKYISPSIINKASGIMFLCIGILTGYTVLRDLIKPKLQKSAPQMQVGNETVNPN